MRSDAKPPTAGTNHRLKQSGALAIAALLAMAIVVATAFAGKDVVQTIGDGDGGSAPGTFSNNNGLDVNDPEVADASEDPYGNPTDGYIYVADEDAARVQVFDSEHNFVFVFGGDVNATAEANICPRPGFPEDDCDKAGDNITQEGGYFDDLQDVAIDQSDGSLYVMDEDNARVQKFSSDGEFLWTVGNNVNADELPAPDLCLAGDTCKAGTNDVAENGFTTNSVGHLAVDPNAPFDLYVADEDHSRIQVFNSEGEFQRMYGYGVQDGEAEPQVCEAGCQNGITDAGENILGQLDEPIDVDIDDAGRIYVLDDDNENVVRFEDGTTFAGPEVFAEADLSGSPKPGRIDISPGPEAASTDDAIYVSKEQEGETRVLELDETGAVTDTHMQGAGIGISSFAGGLAVNRPLGELYVSDDNPDYVFVLDDPLPPVGLVVDPITVKDDKTATFTGTVDPEGGLVTGCAFEYSTDSEFGGAVQVEENACDSFAPNGGPQEVSKTVEGLNPNTTYYVRLRAERPFVSESGTTSVAKPFLTDQVAPYVSDVGAVGITQSSARLAGTINPANSATGYFFEYGATPAMGKTTPPLAIGDGNDPITISQVVSGLAKDTDYYFRLVATNAFGTSLSTQATFRTRALPLPNPANRVYEQVTPVDKNSGDAISSSAEVLDGRVAAFPAYDGEGFAFESVNAFGEDPVAQILLLHTAYVSHRDSDGWGTKALAPPACANDLADTAHFLGGDWLLRPAAVSANVEAAVIPQRESASCPLPPLDPGAILPATNLYRVDLLSNPADHDLLVPEPDPMVELKVELTHGYYRGGSDDYGHLLYQSAGPQAPGAPVGEFKKLYEWDNGTLRLVSVKPDGEPFETSSGVPTGSDAGVPVGINGTKPDMRNVVSASGERMFFLNPTSTASAANCVGACDLYMREGGTATHRVSESECSSECGPAAGKELRWADLEGDAAVFTSAEKLTNDDPSDASSGDEDLYLYRHSGSPDVEANLTLLSRDSEPADGAGDVLGVAGMSDDGETVYFIADNQLIAGEPTGLGDQNIYRWDWNEGEPTLEYLATAEQDWQIPLEVWPGGAGTQMERRVSRDGSALMIETSKRVLPAADSDGDIDVYLWREGRGWDCASCQVPGDPSGGNSTTGRLGNQRLGAISADPLPIDHELASAMSEDGERVFFDTPDPLVAADINGGPCEKDPSGGYYPCTDVYEWHDGKLSLITNGTGTLDKGLVGISEDGRDVFIYTREALVGWDNDELIDVYDARVGGGFPEPPPQPPECEGEGCRDEGTEAPAIGGAGSAVFQGAGNPRSEGVRNRCPAKKLRRGKRCLTPRAIARKRCRRLSGKAKRRCVARQTRRLRRAQRRRAQRAKRRADARAANTYRRASR